MKQLNICGAMAKISTVATHPPFCFFSVFLTSLPPIYYPSIPNSNHTISICLLFLQTALVGFRHFNFALEKDSISRFEVLLHCMHKSVTSKMGSGDWLKNIISLNKARKQKSNKTKDSSLAETNGFILKPCFTEESTDTINKFNRHHEAFDLPAENIAAIRIQTAFRAYKARKLFSNSKRIIRLQMLMEGDFGKKQTSNTLRNLQSWSRIQAQIRTQRLAMVEESGIKLKKLENQLRNDAKARDLEVEWKDSPHTMIEALARIKQREEATIKRERAMAYAFSHQWRAHSNSNLGINDSDLATSNWGWSVMERWIAARPWESRALVVSTPKKVKSPPNKKSLSTKKSNSLKTTPNGKKTSLSRRLSYGSALKAENAKTKPEKNTTM